MKLYEFEGKKLFERAKIKIPRGKVVTSAEEAAGLTKEYGSVMAKAQVLWGKRSKAQGIVPCENEEELAQAVKSLIGKDIFGEKVEQVLVEEKLDIAMEAYLGATYVHEAPEVIVSGRGGVDIEEVSREAPKDILVESVNILKGLDRDRAKELTNQAGLNGSTDEAADILGPPVFENDGYVMYAVPEALRAPSAVGGASR